ncbi:MAG: hypothetical protein V2J62_04860 [candidate division KSB1 bacterium]|nr:hypothetical protein [candidate division KSB1 bacterium]
MKNIVPILVLFLGIEAAWGSDDLNIISQQPYFSIQPVYQSWTGDNDFTFSEMSVPLQAYYPFNRNASLSLQTNQAMVNGDNLEKLSGLTDTQLSLNYFVERVDAVLNLGLNLPSGKKALTLDEFVTSSLLSYDFYNFMVPNFGQGLNVSGGITWVRSLSDQVALGIGATYQLKGDFEPLENMMDKYKPGDEFLATAGIDVRLTETSTISTDLIFISYAADKFGDVEVFESGALFYGNVQYKRYFDFNTLSLFARYRTKGKNRIAVAGGFVDDENKTVPDLFETIAEYRMRINQNLSNRFIAELRFYQEITTVAAINVFGVGIQPDFRVSQNVSIPVRLKYSIGLSENDSRLNGFEAGAGIYFSF